jgi:hypothetical protein
MEAPVAELVGEFVREVRVAAANSDGDVLLQSLVDAFQSSSAMSKRDMRRMLEKDAAWFLQSSCRVLKASAEGPGAVYLMELLWSNPVLVSGLIEPALLPLDTAIRFAKRWVEYDSMLDIKLLQMGFPSEATTVQNVDIVRAKRVLAIVNELPACRHILLPLVNLLHSPDPKVRSKAASLYGRTSQNGDCVRKRLSDMDPRVRANAVESLWGMDSSSARAVLREASRDQHHRVAANALVGLHRIGAYDVTASLQKMADGAEPMGRAAAAFAMGQILNMDFKPVLESLLKDDSPKVRSQALRSLIRLKRQPEPGEEDLAAGSAAPTGDPVPENATDATPPEPPIDAALPGPAVEAAPPEPANAVPAGTLAPSPEVPPVSADKEDKG